MTDKQIIIDGVSNFCLVCYYDNKTNELVRIEQYYDNDSSMYSDIDSYRYGYNAEITKPEEIIKQLKAKEQECERLKEDYTLMKQSRDLALKNYDEEFEYKRQITVEHLEQKKELLKQLNQLKAENEELRTERKNLKWDLENNIQVKNHAMEEIIKLKALQIKQKQQV